MGDRAPERKHAVTYGAWRLSGVTRDSIALTAAPGAVSWSSGVLAPEVFQLAAGEIDGSGETLLLQRSVVSDEAVCTPQEPGRSCVR